jgi:Type II secretion system (T2SS), protein E, N-terminal domain
VTEDPLALAFRAGLPYVGLRGVAHDPELDRVIPFDAARAARVVPLAADDEHVRIAAADPEPDLRALEPYVGDRRIELAIAPRDELEAILGPPPPPVPARPPLVVEGDREPEVVDEPVGAEPGPTGIEEEVPAEAAPEPAGADIAQPTPAPAAAPAGGEVPSWLAPPSRRRRVIVGLVVVLLVALAAGAVLAYLLTR